MNAISRAFMYIYIFIPSAKGVNTLSAKEWYLKMRRNRRKDKEHSFAQKRMAHRAGYMPDFIDKYGFDKKGDRVSERDYLYLQPINWIYRKWIDDNKTAKEIFYPFADLIELDYDGSRDEDRVRLVIVNDRGYYPEITECYFPFRNTEGVEERVNPETGEYSGGTIDCWEEVKQTITKMARFTPQLEFYAVDIIIEKNSFRFVDFMNYPDYPGFVFSEKTTAFLKEKLDERKAQERNTRFLLGQASKRIRWKTRQNFTALFFPKGMMPYLGPRWIKEVVNDFFSKSEASFSTKMWAYRHGFLSYRIAQYGITEENFKDHISDFEYKWLRHINGDYRILFGDKITIKYIVNKFRDCFPEYYYHVKSKNGENIVIPMMDCPEKYADTYEDILALAKEKKELAMKPEAGSHGDGFYRLTYDGTDFYLNFKKATEEDVLAILRNPEQQYLITEYIKNNEQFKKIYEGAVNTIRLIVFKKDKVTPEIGNAYMRFGSKATGAVDNMVAGGIFVELDKDTGYYHDAKILRSNSIEDCPRHPDTGVLIEGYVPHWEQVKKTVLDVAASIPQMEWFGFDVAVTEDGIKFPEINRSPDYPKIEQFSHETMSYLLQKLDEKKKLYGYDKKPCRKLVHLPKR